MGRSRLGFGRGHWAVTPLFLVSASILCIRRFYVFVMTCLGHRAGPLEVNHCSTGMSAGRPIFLKCSLRIFLLCQDLGHGWILSSSASWTPRSYSSLLVNQGKSVSGADKFSCASDVMPPW